MSTGPRFVSVGTKLAIATLVVLGLVFGGVFVVLTRFAREQLIDAKAAGATKASALFLRTIAAPVLFEDKRAIADSIEIMARDTEVLGVQVWSVDAQRRPGALLGARYEPHTSVIEESAAWSDDLGVERTPDRLVLRGPVRDPEGQIVALAAIQYSLARELAAFTTLRHRLLLADVCVAVALTLLLLSLTWRWTIRPLNVLLDGVRQLEAGRPLLIDETPANDELGRLSEAFRRMAEVVGRRETDIRELNAGLELRVGERTAQLDEKNRTLEDNLEQLRTTQQKLMDTSRKLGMADVATSVLHNVGNVLNSVNVSAGVVANVARDSRSVGLGKAIALLKAQPEPGKFLDQDPRGKKLIEYLAGVASALDGERARVVDELKSLTKNIDHIKVIVKTQQSHAKVGAISEKLSLASLVEDALRLDHAAGGPRAVRVEREIDDVPDVETDRHKLLQIVVNLLANARQALDGQGAITVRVRSHGDEAAAIEVEDTGVGIPAENLTRIFNHGFTTKAEGHGFGLHSCACAAIELGGQLSAHSDGVGKGARFTVVVPRTPASGDVLRANGD